MRKAITGEDSFSNIFCAARFPSICAPLNSPSSPNVDIGTGTDGRAVPDKEVEDKEEEEVDREEEEVEVDKEVEVEGSVNCLDNRPSLSNSNKSDCNNADPGPDPGPNSRSSLLFLPSSSITTFSILSILSIFSFFSAFSLLSLPLPVRAVDCHPSSNITYLTVTPASERESKPADTLSLSTLE